jgi:hypothetical protein
MLLQGSQKFSDIHVRERQQCAPIPALARPPDGYTVQYGILWQGCRGTFEFQGQAV